MSLESIIAFAFAMALLAASPGPGLAAVLSRAVSFGAMSGHRVVVGFVLVDFLFLAIAIVGMTAISVALGPLFQLVKYLAAAYLIYLGIQSIRAAGLQSVSIEKPASRGNVFGDVVLGCLVTLGNPKAVLFYGAFLPTFFEVRFLGLLEYLVICGVIVVVSFVIYGVYISLLTRSLQSMLGKKILKRIETLFGLTLIGSGVLVATR